MINVAQREYAVRRNVWSRASMTRSAVLRLSVRRVNAEPVVARASSARLARYVMGPRAPMVAMTVTVVKRINTVQQTVNV